MLHVIVTSRLGNVRGEYYGGFRIALWRSADRYLVLVWSDYSCMLFDS